MIVAGDSAGGNMALTVALREDLSPPGGLALFSPWARGGVGISRRQLE